VEPGEANRVELYDETDRFGLKLAEAIEQRWRDKGAGIWESVRIEK
jgi:hypothetical protein